MDNHGRFARFEHRDDKHPHVDRKEFLVGHSKAQLKAASEKGQVGASQ